MLRPFLKTIATVLGCFSFYGGLLKYPMVQIFQGLKKNTIFKASWRSLIDFYLFPNENQKDFVQISPNYSQFWFLMISNDRRWSMFFRRRNSVMFRRRFDHLSEKQDSFGNCPNHNQFWVLVIIWPMNFRIIDSDK